MYGPFSTSLYFDYVPKTTVSFEEYSNGGVNTDTLNGLAYHIPDYFTMDLAVSYQLPNFGIAWAKNATLTVGANNVFNKLPPYVPGDGNPPGENNTVQGTYDIIGRYLFVELKKDF